MVWCLRVITVLALLGGVAFMWMCLLGLLFKGPVLKYVKEVSVTARFSPEEKFKYLIDDKGAKRK